MAKIPWHFFKIPWLFPDLEKILFFPDISLTCGNPALLVGLWTEDPTFTTTCGYPDLVQPYNLFLNFPSGGVNLSVFHIPVMKLELWTFTKSTKHQMNLRCSFILFQPGQYSTTLPHAHSKGFLLSNRISTYCDLMYSPYLHPTTITYQLGVPVAITIHLYLYICHALSIGRW